MVTWQRGYGVRWCCFGDMEEVKLQKGTNSWRKLIENRSSKPILGY